MLTLQVHTQLHLRVVHHTESSLSIVFWLHPNVQTSLQARSREIQKKKKSELSANLTGLD